MQALLGYGRRQSRMGDAIAFRRGTGRGEEQGVTRRRRTGLVGDVSEKVTIQFADVGRYECRYAGEEKTTSR
jgi:hypothetical protein